MGFGLGGLSKKVKEKVVPQKASYVSPSGARVYSSGVVVGAPSKTSYNAKTNPGPGYDVYKSLQGQLGPSQGGRAAAYDIAYGGARPNVPTGPSSPSPRLGGGGAGGGGGRGRGGGGRRGGGGGGGGGGVSAATTAAQNQIDAITRLLGSGAYKVNPATYEAMRGSVNAATAADQAAATGAYNSLDAYLRANQTNPYANVQMQRAQAAPDMNPYLASQGVGALTSPQGNPEDTGYGAFQNVLALLGAGQQASNQSRLAESQMGRTYSGQQIGAVDNAYLAQIANQQAQAQQALDTERRQAALQLMSLLATPGTKAPDLGALGIA